jgi:monoamine oxidase
MDRLPRALASRLGDRIRYGARVTLVEQDEGSVSVTFVEGGRVGRLTAGSAVLAVPLPLLKEIEFRPGLSEAKAGAAREVPYFAASRTLLQTRTRFWRESQESGFARTDRPAEVTDAAFGQDTRRGLLAVTGLSPVAGQGGSELAEDAFPRVRGELEKEVSVRWREEPWARGAFAAFRPGQMKLLTEIARPEGRLHFAGEHTSPWMGWMEGAIESGERVAREVLL